MTDQPQPADFPPDPADYDLEMGEGFNDAAHPEHFPQALDTAARYVNNMEPAAREDARIIAVSLGGRIQVIGTGKRWPSSDMILIEGPAILVYGKDAIARAAQLRV